MYQPIQKSEEQAVQLAGDVAGEMATRREEFEAKLQKEFQEAIKQLSEVIIPSLYTVDVGATFSQAPLMAHKDVATVY